MLRTKKTNRTLNEESGQETDTQIHGVSRSLTIIRIALCRHWLRTHYDSFCIKHIDIDYAVHSALFPTDESFSLKGYGRRNGQVTKDAHLELRLRMRSPLPILRQTSTTRSLSKDNIILYKPRPPPPNIDRRLDNLHWKIHYAGDGNRMREIPRVPTVGSVEENGTHS